VVVPNGEGKVHEDNIGGVSRSLPFKAMEVAQASFEGSQSDQVVAGRFCWDPDSNNVINEAAKNKEVGSIFQQQGLFEDGIKIVA
jgi:hypothetical protein